MAARLQLAAIWQKQSRKEDACGLRIQVSTVISPGIFQHPGLPACFLPLIMDLPRPSQAKLPKLGRVDKRDSSGSRPMIQAHLYVGDELGTQPDIRR